MVTTPRRVILVAGALALASLWLRAGFPLTAIGSATFDDALFLRTARFLGAGQWLGPYGYLTLVKGMFYPLFVLVCFIMHMPLLITEQAVYLAASAGLASMVGRQARPWVGLLLFGLLAFNPVLWNSELQRVIREGLYISLTLGCVGLSLACVFASVSQRRFVFAAGLGLVLGAFWLTREEGPWLLPALMCVPAVALVPTTLHGLTRRNRAVRILGPLCLAAVLAAAMVLGVATMNWRVYGVFLTTEFQGGAFPKAYGALARITSDQWQPYMVLPADAAELAYAVSPAAQALSPVLDGPRVRIFAKEGCAQMGIDPCPGILASWFMWAMREAVAQAGHSGSAPEAQAFYRRLADEVNDACDVGRIPCGPPLAGFLPPFRRSYVDAAARAAAALAWMVIRVAPDQVGSLPSRGPAYEVEVFDDMAGPINHALATRMVVAGWVTAQGGTPSLAIANPQGLKSESRLVMPASPSAGTGASPTSRFELQTDCQTDCTLVVLGPNGHTMSVPISRLGEVSAYSQEGMTLGIDLASLHDPHATSRALQNGQLRIAKVFSSLYGVVMPAAVPLATLGLITALLRMRRRPPSIPLMALALATIVAIVSRIALLAILDATSIPAVNALYTSPVSPLVIVFAVVGSWLGCAALRSPIR